MANLELPPVPENDQRISVEDRLAAIYQWAKDHDIAVRKVLEELDRTAQRRGRPVELGQFVVATLPRATGQPSLIYVADESGGAVPAFSDGSDYRRVTDRAIVS